MALQRFDGSSIIVEIPDIELQGVQLKRKAYVQSLHIEFGLQQVTLNIAVSYYGANEDGSYAALLDLPGISAYSRSLMADKNVLVNAATGIPVCAASEEFVPNPDYDANDETSTETIWNPLLRDINYMYEFELMMAMMRQPVVMYDMIVGKVQYAAAMKRLD